MNVTKVKAFGTESAEAPLKELTISRRETMPLTLESKFCFAEFVIPIFIPPGMIGVEQSILRFRDAEKRLSLPLCY